MVGVCIAPLPYGSTDPFAVSGLCVVFGASLCLAAGSISLRSQHLIVLWPVALLLLGYALVLHEQTSVHPWLPWVVPAPLWAETGDLLGQKLAPTATLVRDQPWLSIGPLLANLLALASAFAVSTNRDDAWRLLRVIAWSGAAYALYGMISHLVDPTTILLRDKQAYLAVPTSTFINRNTAAAYFGCVTVIWFLIAGERLRHRLSSSRRNWRSLFVMVIGSVDMRLWLPVSMTVICLVALFMTGSRAGVVISVVGLSLAAVLTVLRLGYAEVRSSKTAKFPVLTFIRSRLTIIVLILAGILLVVGVLGARVATRFDIEGHSDAMRLETYGSTERIIRSHPWVGTGLGTFPFVFPAYRSPMISGAGVWDRAHSVPLEMAAELGVPLALGIIIGWMAVFARLAIGVFERRRDVTLVISAFCGAFIAVFHSFIDFPLQIPGFSVVIFALVGMGLAQSFRTRDMPLAGLN